MNKQGQHTNNTAVVILAGGQSKRMGFPKLLLPFDDGTTFVEHIILQYKQVVNGKIILVVNEAVWNEYSSYFEQIKDVDIVLNKSPEFGRTYSIQLGISKLNTNKVFIQNTDNPFVSADMLNAMIALAPDNGYVSPKIFTKGGHPVLLCGNAVKEVRAADRNLSLKNILANQLRVDWQTNDPSVLVNIDTPEHYKLYFPNLNLQFIHS